MASAIADPIEAYQVELSPGHSDAIAINHVIIHMARLL